MHLLKELIIHILSKEKCEIDFNITDGALFKAVESTCFIALNQIKEIANDESLDDYEAIEKIVSLFGDINVDTGSRHD